MLKKDVANVQAASRATVKGDVAVVICGKDYVIEQVLGVFARPQALC